MTSYILLSSEDSIDMNIAITVISILFKSDSILTYVLFYHCISHNHHKGHHTQYDQKHTKRYFHSFNLHFYKLFILYYYQYIICIIDIMLCFLI